MSSSFSSSLLYSLANTTTVAEAVFTAAVGVVVGLAALLFSFHIATRRPVIPLPHPPLQPIFGNLLQQIKQGSRRNEYFSELHERLGMNFTFCIPLLTVRASIVVTAKPENVEHVLKTNFQVYDKGQQLHDNLHALLGNGIFAVDGWKWKTQRKIASHIFTVSRFKEMFEGVFVEESAQLVKVLQKAADTKSVIDMHSLFYAFTLDTFGRIAFGQNFDCLSDAAAKPFAVAFDKAQLIVTKRFDNPFWYLLEPFSGVQSSLKRNVKIIDDFAYKVIADRRSRNIASQSQASSPSSSASPSSDLLDFFLDAKNEDGTAWSDLQLRDIVLSFIIAGRDTTAQALSWGLYELSKHPEVEEKLRSEFIRVLKDDDVIPNHDTMKELKYATAVFYEILRLYPSVPMNIKFSNKDDTWPDGTFVPAKSMVGYAPWAMGRMEAIWGPDAKLFKPERWIDQDGNIKKESPAKWPAFHAGPRTCLGQQLATNEAITVLSLLTRKFKFELMPGQEITYASSLTLPMKNPLNVIVTIRK